MGIKKVKYKISSDLTGSERKQQIFNNSIKLENPTRLSEINLIVNYTKRPLGSILLTAFIHTINNKRNSFVLPFYIDTIPNKNCDVFNSNLFLETNPIKLNFDSDIIIEEINFDLNSIYDSEFEITIITNSSQSVN